MLIVLNAGCVPALIVPKTNDVERSFTAGYTLTLDQLTEAHLLYINKCSNCHFLYRPYQFSKDRWIEIMPEMKKEAKLTEDEYDSILRYLIVMQESTPLN